MPSAWSTSIHNIYNLIVVKFAVHYVSRNNYRKCAIALETNAFELSPSGCWMINRNRNLIELAALSELLSVRFNSV
jgi:hypothetical protein